MKGKGKEFIKLVEETIGLIDKQNTIIDKLSSLVDSLKSVDTDKMNVNQKSAEIMVPVDIQSQSPILVDLNITSTQKAFIPSGKIVGYNSVTNDGYFRNDGTIRCPSYSGEGIYGGDGTYSGI